MSAPSSRKWLESVQAFLAKLKRNECQWCGKIYEGRQRGRCVYCEHCGGRVYQGRLVKKPTEGEARD